MAGPAPQKSQGHRDESGKEIWDQPRENFGSRMSEMPRERRLVSPGEFYVESAEETS